MTEFISQRKLNFACCVIVEFIILEMTSFFFPEEVFDRTNFNCFLNT